MREYIPLVHINEEFSPMFRRLGLEKVKRNGKLCYCRCRGGGAVFPVSIEEAAYLLVGVRYEEFWSPRDKNQVAITFARLREFNDSDGYVIYAYICEALKSRELETLSFTKLVAWSRSVEHLLTKVPPLVRQLILDVASALEATEVSAVSDPTCDSQLALGIREANPVTSVAEPMVNRAIERAERLVESRSSETADRSLFLVHATRFKNSNPSCRFADVKRQPFAKKLLVKSEGPENRIYTEETLKEWCTGLGLNTSPGRPRKTTPGPSGNGG